MRSLKIFIILIFGIFVYFYKLDKLPLGLYIDEASPGYNAYSILKTGRDEYGKFLPVVFRGVGAYNPPLYTYLTVVPVAVFGLSIFSVRFIAALAALISIVPFAVILYSSGLFKKEKSIYYGIFLFIISPWLILYARSGFEVILGFFLFITATCFAWLGIREGKYLILSTLFFCLATYASYPARFISPIFILAMLIVFRKQIFIRNNKKYLLIALILGLIIEIPNLWLLTKPAFFPKSGLLYTDAVKSLTYRSDKYLPHPVSFVLSYIREFSSIYLTYFSPKSLFFLGDPDMQRSIPELGALYFWEVIPYFLGLYFVIKLRKHIFYKFLILLLLITPLAGAFTSDPFAAHRTIMFLLPVSIMVAIGIDRIGKHFIFLLLIIISLLYLWRSFFVIMPHERAKYWSYGTEQLAKIIKSNPDKHFIIDNNRTKPTYINLAFYMKTDPVYFQSKIDPLISKNYYNDLEFKDYYSFANLETRAILWEKDIISNNVLVGDELTVSDSQAKEHGLSKMFEIRDLNDQIIFEGFLKK